MDKLFNMHECINTKDWDEGHIRRFEWRLDLVYTYKIYFDPAVNFSHEQVDFINGQMRHEKMIGIASRYHLAITEAIELAEAAEQRIRIERLAAATVNRSAT